MRHDISLYGATPMSFGLRIVWYGRARWRTLLLFNVANRGSCLPLALLTCLAANADFRPAMAQHQAPAIVMAATLWVAPAEEAPMLISIESGAPLPTQAMVVVRGLPQAAKLSEGRLFGPGVWVVPLNTLVRLKIQAPAEAVRSELNISLVTLSGTSLAEKKVTLLITLPPVRANIPTAAKMDIPTAATLARRPLSDADREFAFTLMERGNVGMKAGNVAVARQFYQRAAERGLAEAAMALAESYDPRELARRNITGVDPDPAQALTWYEKARELGSHDAVARLPPSQ